MTPGCPRTAAVIRRAAAGRSLLPRHWRGPAALMLGAVLFAAMAICVKFAARRIPSGELVMFRFLFGLLMVHVMQRAGLARVRHNRPALLLARGFVGALAIVLYFASIQHTTLVKASLLSNSYPVYAALFGAMLLRERLQAATVAAFLVSAAGVWLVVDPDFSSVAKGDLYGVLSGAVAGLAIVIIRELRRTESAFTVFWYLCVFGTAMGAVSCLWSFVWPDAREWGWILGAGAASTGGQLLITYGLRYTPAAEGSLISMSTVGYSGLFGWMFLGERLSAAGLAGAVLLLGGAGFTAILQSRGGGAALPPAVSPEGSAGPEPEPAQAAPGPPEGASRLPG